MRKTRALFGAAAIAALSLGAAACGDDDDSNPVEDAVEDGSEAVSSVVDDADEAIDSIASGTTTA